MKSMTLPSRAWRRRLRSFTLSDVLIYGVLLIIFVLVAYPFFYILSLAVMPYAEYVKRTVHALPAGFTLFYFQQVLRNGQIVSAFEISIAKTLLGTFLNVIATTMAGYALSRPHLKYRRALTLFFLIPLFVNSGIIPYFLVVQTVGLTNTFWALILPNLVLPFNLFLARAYFTEYPAELIEAAHMDGAGQWRIFWRIVWPTSTPFIATIALLYGVTHWNEYVGPSILVQSNLYPATVVLRDLTDTRLLDIVGTNTQFVSQSFIAAVSAILIIPMLIAYPLLQRFVVKGLLLGSTKG